MYLAGTQKMSVVLSRILSFARTPFGAQMVDLSGLSGHTLGS